MQGPTTIETEELREYLLGRLAEAESERIELRILGDPAFLERVEDVEDELIEAFLAGSLPSGDREPFERHFLASPERGSRLACARLIREHYLQPSVGPGSAWDVRVFVNHAWLGAAAAVLALAVWLVVTGRPERTQFAREGPPAPAETPKAAGPSPPAAPASAGPSRGGPAPELPQTPAQRPAAPAPTRVARVTLIANQTMADVQDGPPVLRLGRDQQRAEIEILIEAPEAYSELRAELVSAAGRVADRRRLEPAAILIVPLSGSALTPSDYSLALTGRAGAGAPLEEVGRWRLVIERE